MKKGINKMGAYHSINCRWYSFNTFCIHPKRKKILGIFKRSCPLVLTDRRCELQERYPKPEGLPPTPPPIPKRCCSCPLCKIELSRSNK